MKKNKHGGARPGSGRKKLKSQKKEPTKVKRIPIAIEDVIDEIIRVHKERLREINS